MHQLQEKYFSDYSVEQLYNLVIDIESYPEFLPWCCNAEVIEKSDEELIADLTIGFKIFEEHYRSKITLNPPKDYKANIKVASITGPFKHLENSWSFEKVGDKTEISFFINFEFKSPILDKLIGSFFSIACQNMMEAFEERANKLYNQD